jgi:drug/metabolite transporter (DMT)-like permease
MAVGTGVFYGGYFLFTERSRTHFDPVSHIWLVGIGASITLFVINTALQHPLTGYPAQTWFVFFSTAIVSQLIGYMALAYALGHLPASVVSPTMVLQPIVTTLLAIPLLGEIPTIWQGIGGAMALVGIYIVNQSHMRSTTVPRAPGGSPVDQRSSPVDQRSTSLSGSVDSRNQPESPTPNA